MQTIQVTTSKEIRIMENSGQVNATFVQVYNGESDVIELKTFSNIKNALRWANQKKYAYLAA